MLQRNNAEADPAVPVPVTWIHTMSFTTEPHIVRSYDERLAELRELLARMGALAATQLDAATAALQVLDVGIATRWPHGERCIDALDAEIERALLLLLALRTPVASDLRLVMTLADAARHLERIGDETGKLAVATVALAGAQCPRSLLDATVRPLYAQVSTMLARALQALATVDGSAAAGLVADDRRLDAQYQQQLSTLIGWMAEHPRGIGAGVQLAGALKALERIGDHARDIGLRIAACVRGAPAGGLAAAG